MAGLVIIRGLPGSGISRLAKRTCDEGDFDFVYEDNMFFDDVKDGKRLDYHKNSHIARTECRVHTFSALLRGYDVVVDNYFVMYKHLLPYVLMSILLTKNYPTVLSPNHKGAWDPVICAGRSNMGFSNKQIAHMKANWQATDADGLPAGDSLPDEELQNVMAQIGRAWALDWDSLDGGKRHQLLLSICGY